jgi:hypothetical protein
MPLPKTVVLWMENANSPAEWLPELRPLAIVPWLLPVNTDHRLEWRVNLSSSDRVHREMGHYPKGRALISIVTGTVFSHPFTVMIRKLAIFYEYVIAAISSLIS